MASVGSGKGALHVAEQFALDQRGHQRTAVDREERFLRVGSVGVDGARHQLLAGAALAQHQNGMRALGHLGEDAVELLHLHRAADHGAQPLGKPQTLAKLSRGHIGQVAGRRAVQHGGELVHRKRFGQVVRSAATHRFHGGIHRARCGHRDHRSLRVEELDLGDHLQAEAGPRREVDQQDVRGTAAKQGARLDQIAGALHGISQAGRDLGAGRASGGVRVYHQEVQPWGRLRNLREKLHASRD